MGKNIGLIILLSLLVSCLGVRQGSDERQKVLVFTHAAIINTSGGKNQSDMTVIITGGRITDIKKSVRIRSLKGAQVIDATGKFLIPGFWDMHVHWYDTDYLPLFIANGVTGVRQMWGSSVHFQWRDKIYKGLLLGPRQVIAGTPIDGPEAFYPGVITVSNENEAQLAVLQVKGSGADFIEVDGRLSPEAYFAIAEESRKLGISFAGGVPYSIRAAEASIAGQKSLEYLRGIWLACSSQEEVLMKEFLHNLEGFSAMHARTRSQLEADRRLQDQIFDTYDPEKAAALFALFVRNSTWQCPTLTVERGLSYLDDRNFTDDPRMKYLPKNIKTYWDPKNNSFVSSNTGEDWAMRKKVYARKLELVKPMHEAGVKFIAGTDLVNPFCFPGFSLHDELSLFVQAGLTPLEALQTATYNAAEFLGQLDSLGTVETGKIADLVVLDANPIEDIYNTRKISAVVVGGKYYPRTSLDEMLVRIETLAAQKSIAETLLQTINEKDLQSAIAQYHELKTTQFDLYDFRESELNTLGYQLLGMNKIMEAIEILKLNVEAYPQSSNVYDSLGEAYMIKGDREQAIMNYHKSLELDPNNSNAAEMLKKLGKE